MGKKLSKSQRRALKEKHRKKKIKKLESQDARGISRVSYDFIVKPKTFFTLKIIGIVSIPIVYFCYSPLLVVVMIYFVFLFFMAIGTEHGLNKSVIKSNHIKIPKYDGAIALLLICVSFFGTVFNVSTTPVGRFATTAWAQFTTSLKNFGSILTGVRTMLFGQPAMSFGSMEKPEDFIPDAESFTETYGDQTMGAGGMPRGGGAPMEMSMDDVPIEFMFSQILSTALTVLIFSVMVLAIISLWQTYKKIKKFDEEQNLVIEEKGITTLSDADLELIVNFGEHEDIETEPEGD